MNGMVEVRIRHAGEIQATHLTRWPLDDLDALLRYVRHWGVYDDESDAEPVGQFVVDSNTGCAYFEVVVGAE